MFSIVGNCRVAAKFDRRLCKIIKMVKKTIIKNVISYIDRAYVYYFTVL